MQVEVRATPTIYEARGEFQLNVETVRHAGVGALYEQFARLKARLEAAGWFAPERKRPLPRFPRAVGIVTSLRAAALSDVLTTLARSMPSLAVILYPASVQGGGAAAEIAAAIAVANARAEVDVLIVCRGGGSIEDLWAFNEEVRRAGGARLAPSGRERGGARDRFHDLRLCRRRERADADRRRGAGSRQSAPRSWSRSPRSARAGDAVRSARSRLGCSASTARRGASCIPPSVSRRSASASNRWRCGSPVPLPPRKRSGSARSPPAAQMLARLLRAPPRGRDRRRAPPRTLAARRERPRGRAGASAREARAGSSAPQSARRPRTRLQHRDHREPASSCRTRRKRPSGPHCGCVSRAEPPRRRSRARQRTRRRQTLCRAPYASSGSGFSMAPSPRNFATDSRGRPRGDPRGREQTTSAFCARWRSA